MVQEMQIRNYSERTIRNYISSLSNLACYYNCSPEKLSVPQIKSYLHYLVKVKNASVSTINQLISAVKILFADVLSKPWDPLKFKRPRKEKKLPVVFSIEEISRFFNGLTNKKHKAIMVTAYCTGMRLDELRKLQFKDIDAERLQVWVRQGKGKKDRVTLLSQKVLLLLRDYYRLYRPTTYLFEGREPGFPISVRTLQVVFKQNLKRTGITKSVTFHSLRHSFATHLLEQGANLRLIQQLLGHKSLSTTTGYLHISRFDVSQVTNPYDKLQD